MYIVLSSLFLPGINTFVVNVLSSACPEAPPLFIYVVVVVLPHSCVVVSSCFVVVVIGEVVVDGLVVC